MKVGRIGVEPKKKTDNLFWFWIKEAGEKLPFKSKKERIVCFFPGGFGGNHSHSEEEAFMSLSKGLELIWKDGEGNIHTEKMDPEEPPVLFVVPSNCWHKVINAGEEPAFLLEYVGYT